MREQSLQSSIHLRRRFSPNAPLTLILFALALLAVSCASGNEPPPAAPREFPPVVSTAPSTSPTPNRGDSPVTPEPASHVAPGADDPDLVLFDYRKDKAFPRPELSPEELRKIFVAVYGEGFEKYEPLIRSAAEGAFTKAGTRQTAYLIQPNNAGDTTTDAEPAPEAQLAIFEGDQLAARLNIGGDNFLRRANHYANILRLSDLNGDGINELLLGASYFNRGINLSWARLVEIGDGRLKLIKDFGVIDEDTCDSEREARITSGVIRRTTAGGKSAPPRFKIDFYRGPCPPGGAARDPSKFRPSSAPR